MTGVQTCALPICIFYSSNNGVSYVDRNDGLRLKQFYSCAIHPTTTNYFIAGAQDNGTHQLINAGLGGSTEVVGGDGAYTHIDQDEPTYQFSAFTRSQYLRSTNGGANWGSVSFSTTIGQFINPTDYDDFFNRMYCSGNAGTYVRWENPQTGSTFNTIGIAAFNGSSVLSVQVSPHTANRVFFGTAGGRVVRVDNAQAATPTGTNITGSSMNTSTVSCVAVGTNDNNLLATFSNYGAAHVWASTTGGGAAGWTNISGNLPDIPVRWAMFYPEDNTKAIIATELGVYETDLINGASTVWVQNSSFPVVKTTMLQYRKSDGILLAASYGRGLWTAPIPFTNPYTRFASDYNSQTEATTATTATCRNYRDYTVNMNIDQAPTGNANLTLSVAGGSTATQGVDFDFTTNGNFAAPSNIVTFANGTTTAQTVTIRIYNDAEVESEEFFTLNYSIGGGTNAVAAPSSQAFTFTIANNDVAPVIPFSGTNFGVGVNNFAINGASPFQGNLPKFRIQYLFTKDELNASGITSAGNITAMNIRVTTKGSTLPYTGFTISMGHTAVTTFSNYVTPAFTQVFTGNYSSVVGDNNFVFTTPFVWDGISNVVVQMCYDNTATTSVVDIMEGTDAPLGVGVRASVFSSATTGVGCSLAAAFISDTRIRAIFSADVSATPIESVLNTNKTEYIPGTGNHYFYNGANIISGLTAVSANLGCVTSNVFEAGNTWQVFNSGFRSQKVIDITPTTNSGATYTVSLYYTAAELTGQTPALLKIAKTNAATMATADGTNTVIAASTTVTPYGTGYIFSATFTGFSKFFLVNAGVALPVTLVSFSGTLNTQNNAALQWKISNEINLRSYEIERSYDGLQFTSAGIVSATAGGSLVKDYTFTDPVTAKSVNYYRLKMIDIDGRVKYSDVIILKNNRDVDFVQLLKNPVQNSIPLSINNKRKERITTELYSTTGQLISKWDIGSADGTVQLPFTNNIAPGIYTLRIIMGNKTVTLKISKQ